MGNKALYQKRHSRDKWLQEEVATLPPRYDVEIFVELLLDWYAHNGRKYLWREKSSTLFQKVIAEILLQRTRADTVASYLPDFLRQFPSWNELSAKNEEELHRALYPLGLWRQKAIVLRGLADKIMTRRGEFPKDYNEIRDLPGVGQYLANAIAMFSIGEPRPLLDVNMVRVLGRYFGPRKLVDFRDDPYVQTLAYSIVLATVDYVDINFAILDLAALICMKKPLCSECPINKGCKFWVSHGNL